MAGTLRFIGLIVKLVIPFAFKKLGQSVYATYHGLVYRAVESPKNVVVVGGSFAGWGLAKRLTEILPTGYRVVLIEKNSHFNYLFVFPRFSVVPGHESSAFIPYDAMFEKVPNGIFHRIQDSAVDVNDHQVVLASGQTIDYEYLAIATGSSQPLPARVVSTDRKGACAELRSVQDGIKDGQRIAVVGAGAVGVEVATDIKDHYPDKDVTLVQSRAQLMPSFGSKLHDHVLESCEKLGIRTILGERPVISGPEDKAAPNTLKFSDGRSEQFDMIIPCTGQSPNSGILKNLAPTAISKQTGRVLVRPTLQIADAENNLSNIFALGDVAEHGGPKMARACLMQVDPVAANIFAMISGRSANEKYVPNHDVEGSVKLTLGLKDMVMYIPGPNGNDMLMANSRGKEDFGIRGVWGQMGAKFNEADHV